MKYKESTNLINGVRRYREFITPIKCEGFEIIGFYPYRAARLKYEGTQLDVVSLPRGLFKDMEDAVRVEKGVADNKWVLVFKDTRNFGGEDFVVRLYDGFAQVGKYRHLIQDEG